MPNDSTEMHLVLMPGISEKNAVLTLKNGKNEWTVQGIILPISRSLGDFTPDDIWFYPNKFDRPNRIRFPQLLVGSNPVPLTVFGGKVSWYHDRNLKELANWSFLRLEMFGIPFSTYLTNLISIHEMEHRHGNPDVDSVYERFPDLK